MDDQLVLTMISEPEVAAIPGLSLRGFEGEVDYANILAVIEGSKDADQVERSMTLEDITNNYTYLHNSDPHQDMLFVEVNNQVVGYTRVQWSVNDQGEWLGFHLGFLLPEWRRQGIGRLMLRYNEQRLREIATQQIQTGQLDGSTARFFEVEASESEENRVALFLAEGYRAVRWGYTMVRSLTEPVEVTALPEGVEVRPAGWEDTRAIWEAVNEAFQDHWNYIPETEEDYQRFINDPITDPSLWIIGWQGDQVAGTVLNFLDQNENKEYNRQRGYTEGICVRRPWRRKGLARALLTRSLKMFQDMEMSEAALGVDTQNLSGALRLYESVGFRPVKKGAVYRKPLEV
jgi:mycothiol synthase